MFQPDPDMDPPIGALVPVPDQGLIGIERFEIVRATRDHAVACRFHQTDDHAPAISPGNAILDQGSYLRIGGLVVNMGLHGQHHKTQERGGSRVPDHAATLTIEGRERTRREPD